MTVAAGDGVFSIQQDGYVKLVDLKTNTTSNLVNMTEVRDVRVLNATGVIIFYTLCCRTRDGLSGGRSGSFRPT